MISISVFGYWNVSFYPPNTDADNFYRVEVAEGRNQVMKTYASFLYCYEEKESNLTNNIFILIEMT